MIEDNVMQKTWMELRKLVGSALFVLALGLMPDLAAQTPLPLAFTFGDLGQDYGKDVAVDAGGNRYAVGYFQGTIDLDPGPQERKIRAQGDIANAGAVDMYIAKYAANGSLAWGFGIGSPGSDMPHTVQVDHHGDLVVTGYFGGRANFDPAGSSAGQRDAGAGRDAFVAKYSPEGAFRWVVTMGNPEATPFEATDLRFEEGMDVCVDAEDNVYLTGVYDGTIDLDPGAAASTISSAGGSRDLFVASYTTAGQFRFGFSLGGTGQDHGHGIRVAADGAIVLGGFFSGSAMLGIPNPAVSAGLFDGFVGAYDRAGKARWLTTWGGAGAEQVRPGALEIGPDGAVFTAGDFSASFPITTGEGAVQLRSRGAGDIFLAKLEPDGRFSWVRTAGGAGGDAAHRVDLDARGNIYVAGWAQGEAVFGDQRASAGALQATAVMVAKYDARGTCLWSRMFSGFAGSRTELPMAAGLAVTPSGVANLTGRWYGNTGSPGKSDAFLAVLDADGAPLSAAPQN